MSTFFRKIAICGYVFLLLLGCGGFFPSVSAQTNGSVDIYLFYGDGCPHCAKEREYLSSLEKKYADCVSLHEYEVYYNSFNSKLFSDVVEKLSVGVAGVPLVVYGDTFLVGYESDQTTGSQIAEKVETCLSEGCGNLFKEIMSEESSEDSDTDGNNDPEVHDVVSAAEDNDVTGSENKIVSDSGDEEPLFLTVPLVGEIDLKDISLPISTALIAFVDGFNPCAMWILIFLITMLINMEDRKKLYILGSVFILTSGLVYFVFLAAWFNFFKLIGFVYWIKVVIGIVAVVSGILHIKSALLSKGGCRATNRKQREGIMERIKRSLSEQSFLLSIIGIMTLAVSVNLIEVVCSAGLPAVYTSLLSTIVLSTAEYYFYLFLYVIVFMLDDLFVFFVAVKTYEVTGITQKYSKWSSLIGGILIGAIGVILIVKPDLLMFG